MRQSRMCMCVLCCPRAYLCLCISIVTRVIRVLSNPRAGGQPETERGTRMVTLLFFVAAASGGSHGSSFSLSLSLRRRGNTENPWPRFSGAAWGKQSLKATVDKMCGRFGQERVSEPSALLFNILTCDERINEARLQDPYAPFSVAGA
ncbi:hypothetical protein JOB18_035816 [Solea senegalensis]|uniref:Secreted protein n=1 Tax=Solea senegalensis TaxID=28829 RepID=A0AAV6RUD4_SOLSE|nr:hypothetical protein JOB18_035816 [Solea senegalensis]